MQIPFLDLSHPEAPWTEQLEQVASDVIRSGRYLHGQHTEKLEERLRNLYGTKEAICVSNGLDALRLIITSYLRLGRLKRGDKVAVPANTYIASVLPITEFGLVPLFIDVRPDSRNMDLDLLKNKLTSEVKAVMLVHLYGNPVWNAELMNQLHERGIIIIEDNAQAIGAVASSPGFNDKSNTGGLGDASATSFYPTKNIGALGDAGAVATSDPQLANMIRTLANYGSDYRYHNIEEGYNCRIDELQAAFINVKLDYLTQITNERRHTATLYTENITNNHVRVPAIDKESRQVWHQYVISSPARNQLSNYLRANGIGTDIHYPVPPYQQPCYAGRYVIDCPVTDRLSNEILSLPIASVTDAQAGYIIETINRFSPDSVCS